VVEYQNKDQLPGSSELCDEFDGSHPSYPASQRMQLSYRLLVSFGMIDSLLDNGQVLSRILIEVDSNRQFTNMVLSGKGSVYIQTYIFTRVLQEQ